MKKVIMAYLALFTLSASAGMRIVSDFDDTLKRSNIPDAGARAVGNSIMYKKAYQGMAELYQAMEKQSNGLYILSASPSFLRSFIKMTMKTYAIPYQNIFTRSLSDFGRKEEYKIEKIESVLQNHGDQLILLGDDVEIDPDIYKQVKYKNPRRISQIYIRRVLNKPLPQGVVGFHSAFEVAAREYKHKRLSLKDVKKVAKAILSTSEGWRLAGWFSQMDKVIPDYAHCPERSKDFTPFQIDELAELNKKVQNKIIRYCLLK